VLVCGDLNHTPQAATTQILLGRPGSQLGIEGFNQSDWATATGSGTWPPKCPLATR
jgi:hypothetical protein